MAVYNFRKPTADDLLIMSSEQGSLLLLLAQCSCFACCKLLSWTLQPLALSVLFDRAAAPTTHAAPTVAQVVHASPAPATCLTCTIACAGRTNNRSAWAAQLAKDAGLQRCLVHRQGVYGWHFEATVLPYRRFGVAEPPPDPEPFQAEETDAGAGRLQLSLLGLL